MVPILRAQNQFESHVLNITIPADWEVQFANTKVNVNGIDLPLWPAGQQVAMLSRSGVFATYFADFEILHGQLIESLVRRANPLPANAISNGGKKLRENDEWQQAFAQLLTKRALLLFCKCFNVLAAHTIDRWFNVMQRDEYSAPHCHYFAKGAINYFIDPGESDADHPLAGRFALQDSRIAECCSKLPGYPNAAMHPSMKPGTMLVFPGSFLHFVHPYRGSRPRLTATWNVNDGHGAEQSQT